MVERCELHLIRDWEGAWRTRIRPWLAAPPALRGDCVIVPTRGQAHALKLRCVREGLPLLGVEFLTAELAWRKWCAAEPGKTPAMDRRLLLLNLRSLIADRLAGLEPTDRAWGWWKSLESDAERALDDFEELLRTGFAARDFPHTLLQQVFRELEERVELLGYELAPRLQLAAGLRAAEPEEARFSGRVLVLAFAAENWAEFFPLAALVRRSRDLLVLLPEPELRGRKAPDEGWVEAWSALLGVEPQPVEPAEEPAGAEVARLWTGEGGNPAGASLLIGHMRADEVELVANELLHRLEAGSSNIAVVLPRPGAVHQRLVRALVERAIPFNDLLVTTAPPGVDAQLQRGMLDFHEGGARLEGLLSLWPRLRALSHSGLSPGRARAAAERAFEQHQSHGLADLVDPLERRGTPDGQEVARVARQLLPLWPERLSLSDAVGRFEGICARFRLPLPENWAALQAYAARDRRNHPRAVVIAALRQFLPDKSPALDTPGRGMFAPVTLTTRRRAAGLGWSDVFFLASNAGCWPERRESSCWLTDEQRETLNRRSRFTVGLFTSSDRARFEKSGYADVARNTTGRVHLAASRVDEDDPEAVRSPNAWLERVLLARAASGESIDEAFAGLACAAGERRDGPNESARRWADIWVRRRDPTKPFDEYFLCADPIATRPASLSARLIERGVKDPAELWFQGVLGLRRVAWLPLVRARKRALGSLAHGLLARALRGVPVEGDFMARPPEKEAQQRLGVALAEWRRQRPPDRYWDSFSAELGEISSELLRRAYALGGGSFVAVETRLPEGTTVSLPPGRERLEIEGRVDLVWSDRPRWAGAEVDIVDFKTGLDARLSAGAMARGVSLQLGLYLAAAESLGAACGRVWMVKPDAVSLGKLEMAELPIALAALARVARHLSTGKYGALTPDRTEFSQGFDWPVACAPVRHEVLARKFAATFGTAAAPGEEGM